MKKAVYWKMFFILLTLCTFGVIVIFPYILTVQKDLLKTLPVPLTVFFVLQLFQSIIIFSVAILIGLKLYKKIGLSTPVLEAVVTGKKLPSDLLSIIKTSALWGIFAGIAIGVLDYFFYLMGVTLLTKGLGNVPVWQRFLASFYGGINEEVLMRLFLMTLFIWIGIKITKRKNESVPVVWTAIIITSIIFGIGHLPITASFTDLSQLVIFRGILLNSIGGIIFGWLYWKKGLEAAVISHFSADIIIQVLIPLIISL
jgi:membrane protease YdiL (CAAX protease family)